MRKRSWLSVVALLGAITLLAAACSNKSTNAGGGGGGGGSNVQEQCNSDPFGCVTYQKGEPIKIGTLLAISGDVASLGLDSQHGVQLAIDYLDGNFDGKGGQIDGHDLTMVNEDDGCSAEGGQAGATKLAADPQILAVIGTSCSSAALGVADKILSDKGVLLISPSNTNPNLTAEGTHQPFYLRTAHNDKIQGAIVADFAYDKLGARSAATIHDESPYADALAAVFRQVFQQKGGTITDSEAIQSTDTDFGTLLTKQAAGVPGLDSTVLMGSDGCLSSDFLKIAGSAADGAYASSPDLSVFA